MALLGLAALPSRASTITVGTFNTKDQYPFGITYSGAAEYIGDYQQVYATSVFSSRVLITQVAFSSYYSYPGTASYSISMGLGVTTRTPASPGSSFASSFTPVFSGAVPAQFTAASPDFDLPISLTTPFSYDPAQGNLLLDVTVSSVSGSASISGFIFWADGQSSVMGQLWSGDSSVVTTPNQGLVTQFTVTEVPEPNAGALYCFAATSIFLMKMLQRRLENDLQ